MQPGGVDLGRVGVWAFQFSAVPMAEARDMAVEVEALGYGAIWIPEAGIRDPFVAATALLAATDRVALATGIASIWARPAMTMHASQMSVAEAFPGRFLLGLGVSHQISVEGFYGEPYEKPYSAMAAYLDAMDRAFYLAAAPPAPPPRVLAALGPRMLRLARDRAAGAHPYNVIPEHTAQAREVLGPEPFIGVEHAVACTEDPDTARRSGRHHLSRYLGLPNYTNNLLRLGFTEDDVADGGSDRLVDALVAWGSPEQIREKVGAHFEAGADHVCIQVLPARDETPLDAWRRLAPALLDA